MNTTQRRCGLEEIFAAPFIELIALAPKNPVVRGLILAQTRHLPGPECETFEQIKDWVETTCEKKVANRPITGDGISIKVEFSEKECGTAHYSVPRFGTDEFRLDPEELFELIQKVTDIGGTLDEVVEKISDLINEEAWSRCEPDLDDNGDYDYEGHDCVGNENAEISFLRSQVEERVTAFLRDVHPELLEELT